jgi:hypothetical protein
MCFFFSFLPATIWLVLGYFLLFTSANAEGTMRTFGRVLAIWTFIIAAFIPVVAAFITLSGLCPLDALMQSME